MSAADARRGAHAKLLAGQGGEIAPAESAHAVALRAAADEIRQLLADAGETPSPATMNAVTETLQALPGSARPGRLTRPLRPAGFEALAGLVPTSERTLRGLTPAPPPPPKPRAPEAPPDPRAARRDAEARKREEQARRRARVTIEKALRDARHAGKKADAALVDARRMLAHAKEERARLQDQLQFAIKKIDDAAEDVRTCEGRVAQAGQEQSHLEAKLAAAGDTPSGHGRS